MTLMTGYANLGDAVANATPMKVVAAIVTSIRSQCAGTAAGSAIATRHMDRLQGGNRSFEVMHLAAIKVQPQRDAVALYDDMPFAGLPSPGTADFVAPFFAFT